MRGFLAEGRDWLGRGLALTSGTQPGATRALALTGAGDLAYLQADYLTARALHEQSLAMRRSLADTGRIASSLLALQR